MFDLIVTAAFLMVGDLNLSTNASRIAAPDGLTFQAGYAVHGSGTWTTEFYLRYTEDAPPEWVARRSLAIPGGREQAVWATATSCPVIPDVVTSLNRLDFGSLYVPELRGGGPRLFVFPPPAPTPTEGPAYTIWGISMLGGGFADYTAHASSGLVAEWTSSADAALAACWTSTAID